MVYAKIKKCTLQNAPLYYICICIDVNMPSLQTSEGSLTLHTWPKGSLSCIGSVYGINTKSVG